MTPIRAEGQWPLILWHVKYVGGWLLIVTVVLILSKEFGDLPLAWRFVFLPSLVYSTLGGLIVVVGYSLDALCWWIHSPVHDPCRDELSCSPVPADSPGKRKKAVVLGPFRNSILLRPPE